MDIERYAGAQADEVDLQVATARRYPRSASGFENALMTLVCQNEETAESCIFALPRAGKTIEGPSIRFAELAITAYGNLRVRARTVDLGRIDPEFVTVEGACWDLETNVAMSKEVRRRITDKDGKRYSGDLVQQTNNAGASIAIRNAVLSVIPRTKWEPAYKKAREVVAGNAVTMPNRRASAIEYLAKFGVREDMILATLGKKTVDDLGMDEIVTLRAAARAIRDGEITVEEAFIDPKKEEAKAKASGGMDALISRLDPAAGAASAEKPAQANGNGATGNDQGAGVDVGTGEVAIVPPVTPEAVADLLDGGVEPTTGPKRKK